MICLRSQPSRKRPRLQAKTNCTMKNNASVVTETEAGFDKALEKEQDQEIIT